jgi:putative transposase
MAWKGVTIMDQRLRFISDYLNGQFPIAELCRQFNVSRKTGYKWITRYDNYGPHGLEDRSSKPHNSPTKTEDKIIKAITEARYKHPTWGPKKLLVLLRKRHPKWTFPAISTTADILKREGLIACKPRRFRRKHPGCPTTLSIKPNQIWSADYKGHFKMKNGQYCYPLTVCDIYSRYLLGCEGHESVSLRRSKRHFTSLFKEYGLPDRIRTDNGVPFASNAIARISSLSVWWIKLGIYPELIEPGKPQQNGKHERMHRTLKKEATIPAEQDLKSQQKRFNEFQKEYNDTRPHEALDMETPSDRYYSSGREMPKELKHWDYPPHFVVRLVSKNGGFRWTSKRVPLTHTLENEYIGLEEIDDGIYNVYYCDYLIGRFFEEILSVKDVIERVPIRLRKAKECYQRP